MENRKKEKKEKKLKNENRKEEKAAAGTTEETLENSGQTEENRKPENAPGNEEVEVEKDSLDAADTEADETEKRIQALEEKIAKEKDDYLRLMAEFDNFRRRTSQERLELVSTAAADTIKGLLPVLDDFERAMKALKDSSDSDTAKEGTELIYNKLMGYLKTKGLEVIESLGKDFDTDLHEAVAQFPVEEADRKGKVYDVVQTGYTLNGKVLRFAKVVVAI